MKQSLSAATRMKSIIALIALLALPISSFAASKTLMKCAVQSITSGGGARINLLQREDGTLRANYIEGTTVSGTMFRIESSGDGEYIGAINGSPEMTIRLVVTDQAASNPYIEGYRSSLEVVYPDLNSPTGQGSFSTTAKDGFVCGKQISDFGG